MTGSPISIRETSAGAVFRIRVVPRASRREIAGVQDDALKIRITAAPVEGRANEECINMLAKAFGVQKARVTILAGHTARTKTVSVAGLKAAEIAALIATF